MATIVQQTSQLNESAAVAYGSNNKLGNLLVLASVAANSPSTTNPTNPVVTDTQGNTWIVVPATLTLSATGGPLFAQSMVMAYCPSCKAGANSVTVNWGTVTHSFMCLWEVSGPSQLDGATNGTGTFGSAATAANIVTHGSNEVVLVHACSNDNNPTSWGAGTGFNIEPNTNAFNADEYELLAAPATVTPQITVVGGSGTWLCAALAFSEVIYAPEDGGYIPPVGGDWDRNITVFQ